MSERLTFIVPERELFPLWETRRGDGWPRIIAYAVKEGWPVLISTLRVAQYDGSASLGGRDLVISGERGGIFDHSDMD